jgi:hypothetical protein
MAVIDMPLRVYMVVQGLGNNVTEFDSLVAICMQGSVRDLMKTLRNKTFG